ncbi:MAG: FAD-binding oxidoreductase [Chlamydiia bacterium]|nr:FAD-binding oxidoreductase [Chlamydiia bacterium]
MMHIAVIGAGLAGLAVSWHLLQKPGYSVDLFDPLGISGGASRSSSGLLHPLHGRHALPSWRGEEGMAATRALVDVAERASGKIVASRSGILRLAVTEEQRKNFAQRGEWWEIDEVKKRLPLAAPIPGLWIAHGMTIYTSLYLQGLWSACQAKGAKLVLEKVTSLHPLDSYDGAVLATGFETMQFSECAHLPLKKTAGQALLCRWEEPLPFSLLSHGHIALTEDPTICRIGATYEHGASLSENVVQELKEKVSLFYPPAQDFEVLEVQSGVRMSPKEGARPIVEQIKERIWVFTGLGSRGMLYHALLGKELAERF